MNKDLFQHELFLGFVSKINASRVVVHVPSSTYMDKFFHYGERFHGGLINTYIIIEGESMGFIGRISSAEIPEKERLELSTVALKQKDFHPLVEVEVLSTFDYQQVNFHKSITYFPNIGSKVYMCSARFIEQYLQEIEIDREPLQTNGFSELISPNFHCQIDFSLQSLFGRHAAIIGTTGSGKSWTTSSLISNLIENGQKAILIDATGEYASLADEYCQDETTKVILGDTHILPYEYLSIEDLFYLLTPAPNIQAPKLKEAIRSLKLLDNQNVGDQLNTYIELSRIGIKTISKSGRDRETFQSLLNNHLQSISKNSCDFDIRGLAVQVQNECIWPSGRQAHEKHLFGDTDDNALGHCSSLITRIEGLISNEFYDKFFDFKQLNNSASDMIAALNDFIIHQDQEFKLFYIDISEVPFSFEIREVIVDIIGQHLLRAARDLKFSQAPLTIFIDEAHQFINNRATTDYAVEYQKLEAFESIAKEGRKYGLFLTLSTQLPRDIPMEILSQIGTIITHRLINQRDKEIIMHSLPTISKNIINYLPILGQGEAIISGSEFKDNLYVKINKPKIEPKSETPKFSN